MMKKPHNAVWIASAIALGVGILPLDWYGFYPLLRIGITITAAWMTFYAFTLEKTGWGLLFGAIAILFNPIYPIYMEKETWQVIDALCSALFICGGIITSRQRVIERNNTHVS